MAELVFEGVTKRFGSVVAVAESSLRVGDGDFVVLLGPTGAGKTTTLRLAAGLERPDAGRMLLGGRDVTRVPPADRDTAFIFQQYSLYPHLSVYDNLAFPLRSPARREPEERVRARVSEIARLLHIEDKLANRATELSGGQMQRVAIGRALVRRPSIYLMDEPLSSLDAKLRAELRVELKRIQRELGATILYVTHDQTEAMTMATHIGVLDHGRLVQIGTPRQIYADPVNAYVATRLGSPAINLLPRRLYPEVAAPAGTATIGVRTEHVRIRRSANGSAIGRVKWIEHLGDQNHLHVTVADTNVVTLCGRDVDLAVGDAVDVDLTAPLFFAEDGERLRIGEDRAVDTTLQRRLFEKVTSALVDHAEELTTLDQAIGDGDHGINMKRGALAVLERVDELAASPLPEALKAAGQTLVMKVGGASGPLYGTLFITLGKDLPDAPNHDDLVRAMGSAIAAVKKIGRSDVGQKTMLDVLAPVHEELLRDGPQLLERLRQRAAAAAEATVPMKAIKGRASFLGARSIGHMDPGARSSSLMIAAVCAAMEE